MRENGAFMFNNKQKDNGRRAVTRKAGLAITSARNKEKWSQ